ncbi:MAG TPA: phosphatase PAP2 family protein [Limnochordia bacterium]
MGAVWALIVALGMAAPAAATPSQVGITTAAIGTAWLLLEPDLDRQGLEWAQTTSAAEGPGVPGRTAMEAISFLGDGRFAVPALLLLAARDPEGASLAATAFANAGLTVVALKVLAGRERPWVPGSSGQFTGWNLSSDHHSFPSGHAATSFALATVLSDRYPEWRVALWTAAALVAFSRVALGHHWPSDVLAGAALGMVVGQAILEQRYNFVSIRF